jgi:hypothetical protein
MFKTYIEPLFFNYITDTVSNVREVGIKSLETIVAKFGASWTQVTLIPKLQNFLTQPKISYLHRMCVLNSLAVLYTPNNRSAASTLTPTKSLN